MLLRVRFESLGDQLLSLLYWCWDIGPYDSKGRQYTWSLHAAVLQGGSIYVLAFGCHAALEKPVIMCAHLQFPQPLGSPPLLHRGAIAMCIVLSFLPIRQAGVRIL